MADNGPSEEVPVERTDMLVLVVVSILGGLLIAVWTVSVEFSPQFVQATFVGATMLAFFLFVPVMGLRLFLEDRRDD